MHKLYIMWTSVFVDSKKVVKFNLCAFLCHVVVLPWAHRPRNLRRPVVKCGSGNEAAKNQHLTSVSFIVSLFLIPATMTCCHCVSCVETHLCGWSWFLAHDAFVERIVVLLPWCPSVCLSVRPSVSLGQACIVIIQCTLAWIWVYGWIVQCSGHPDTKACPPTPNCLFPVPHGTEVGHGCAN